MIENHPDKRFWKEKTDKGTVKTKFVNMSETKLKKVLWYQKQRYQKIAEHYEMLELVASRVSLEYARHKASVDDVKSAESSLAQAKKDLKFHSGLLMCVEQELERRVAKSNTKDLEIITELHILS